MDLSGHTTHFAVLGHPIGHTLSPVMHNASFQALGLDAVYLAFDVDPDRLMDVLKGMRDMGFGGVNLTVPLKEVAFRNVGELDDSAGMLGAVNTIQFLPDGTLKGYNTDGMGFLKALQEAFGEQVAGKSIFILGAGGAGRALAITCAAEKPASIVTTDVQEDRAVRLCKEIEELYPGVPVQALPSDPAAWASTCAQAELVIQATPVGMKQEDTPLLKADAFAAGQKVYDLVYMYPQTQLMNQAAQAGAQVSNGLGMLLHQGAHSYSIWTGQQADSTAMRSALEKAVYKR